MPFACAATPREAQSRIAKGKLGNFGRERRQNQPNGGGGAGANSQQTSKAHVKVRNIFENGIAMNWKWEKHFHISTHTECIRYWLQGKYAFLFSHFSYYLFCVYVGNYGNRFLFEFNLRMILRWFYDGRLVENAYLQWKNLEIGILIKIIRFLEYK